MNTSDSISKIAPALLKAQRSMTFAVKDSKNPHFKSTYADLGSVIDACKPALNEAGIAFMQMPAPSDPGSIALTTRLVHESGEWIESTATCPLPKNDPQGYGSANTYLRRYALAAAVGLYQDDDDGNAASRRGAVNSSPQGPEDARGRVDPIAASFRSSPTMGAMDQLREEDPDAVLYIHTLASTVIKMVENGKVADAFHAIEKESFGDPHKPALWSLLPAPVRTALTKFRNSTTKETA